MTNSCQTNSMSDQLTCSSLAVKCLPVACSWRNLGWSLDKFDRLPTPMLFGNPPASTSLAVTPRTSQLRSLANHQNINLSESECAKSTRLWTDLLFLRETAGRCVNETPIDMLRIYVLKRELGHSNWSWEFVALYIYSICSNGNQTRLKEKKEELFKVCPQDWWKSSSYGRKVTYIHQDFRHVRQWRWLSGLWVGLQLEQELPVILLLAVRIDRRPLTCQQCSITNGSDRRQQMACQQYDHSTHISEH